MPLTPQELATGTACLDCQIPAGLRGVVLISLLAGMAGVPLDAQTLVNNARCLECLPAGTQQQVIVYLLGQLVGQSDPQTILNNSRCFACLPPGTSETAMIYLLNELT